MIYPKQYLYVKLRQKCEYVLIVENEQKPATHLKNDGLEEHFPFEMVLQGIQYVHFRGCIIFVIGVQNVKALRLLTTGNWKFMLRL